MIVRETILLTLLCPALALAGANKGQDEVGPGPDEGPGYFGVVRDTAGAPVNDARVSATYRSNQTMVTRSNAAGAYRLPGFKKGINPDDVTISCAKEGYRQSAVVRRPPPGGQPVRSIETECRLQKS